MRPAVAPISQTQRLELIRRVHDDASIPLQDRVVALLILLYAQPVIKIARLTVADVEPDAGEVRLRLGMGEAVLANPSIRARFDCACIASASPTSTAAPAPSENC